MLLLKGGTLILQKHAPSKTLLVTFFGCADERKTVTDLDNYQRRGLTPLYLFSALMQLTSN